MKQKKTIFFALIGLLLLALGLGIALTSVKKSQELRKKAAVPQGPAVLTVVPASTAFPAGQPVVLNLTAMVTSGIQIDGFQIFARIEGTIPDDIKLVSQSIDGLRSMKAVLTRDAGGANLTLASIAQDLGKPYTPSQSFVPAKLTFTAPASGTMSIVFDQKLTKTAEHQTSKSILFTPNDERYSFVESGLTITPTPTGVPILEPTPTSTPTPTPRPTATPMPTAIPTPTPIPTSTPTPTPRPTATPIPTSTPTPQPTATPIPTAPPIPIACLPADINRDGTVDIFDYSLLIQDFFIDNPANPRSDINGDGTVDITDYSMLIALLDTSTGPCQ